MLNTLCAIWSRWRGASTKGGEIHGAILAVSVVVLAIFWKFWTSKNSKKASAPMPPGPRGLPFFGYLPFLGTNLHWTFTELAGLYGPIYKLRLGKQLCVVMSSPSLVREVVRDQDIIFANRDSPIAALAVTYGGNDIAFSPYGPEWRKLRKVFVREMLGKASLDACYALRRQEIKKTIRDVYINKVGTPIIISELTLLTVINAVMSMVWGGTLQGEKGTNIRAEFRELVTELMVLLGKPNVSDIFPLLARFDIQGIEKRMKRISGYCDRIFNSAIDQRMNLDRAKEEGAAKNEQKKDFLQYLLELKKQEDGAASITLTQLKAMLMDIVVGGTDTTSTVVEWVMTEMMVHPAVMKKVNEELTEVVGLNKAVEEFHLPKLQYLDAVVKETVRLHPALPLLVPRCPSQTCNVGGYTIPKGTKIFLNVWAIHRDPQLWDNPLEFRPERFLDDASKWDYSGNNFQYLPFGSGRRICAGLPLAERMLLYVLASFIHSFEWKLPNGTELELSENFGVVMKKRAPLVVIPTPRLFDFELYA
ncbi:hypothetical protein L1049_006757 [Liquidambar formosana]|uniref:Cytochrome P450 n=1 Tax=Liquidambar formosana TaxID=63359 RepID=A0AAP0RHP2_LIQFO